MQRICPINHQHLDMPNYQPLFFSSIASMLPYQKIIFYVWCFHKLSPFAQFLLETFDIIQWNLVYVSFEELQNCLQHSFLLKRTHWRRWGWRWNCCDRKPVLRWAGCKIKIGGWDAAGLHSVLFFSRRFSYVVFFNSI